MGWDRNSEEFKNLQKAYVGQLTDMYRLGEQRHILHLFFLIPVIRLCFGCSSIQTVFGTSKVLVNICLLIFSDKRPIFISTRHDKLTKYLTSQNSLARWAVQNSLPGYNGGRRQIYEWMTQLESLQHAAEAEGLQVERETVDVVETLCSTVLLPSFFDVTWSDEMKQSFKLASIKFTLHGRNILTFKNATAT